MKKNNTYIVNDKRFTRAMIKAEDNDYAMTTVVDEKVVRKIPIYVKSENPENVQEYLKLISKNEDEITMEYRDSNGQTKNIDVDISYSKDPYFVKRAGWLLVLPAAISLDFVFVIFSRGGYPTEKEEMKRISNANKY